MENLNLNLKTSIEQGESVPKKTALELIWGRYRTWDKTANIAQGRIRRWRGWILIFIILGAFCGVMGGTIGAQLGGKHSDVLWTYISQVFSLLSTIFVSFSAFAASEILSDDTEEQGINARALAETYKSEIYLYLFGVSPYDKDADDVIFDRVNKIVSNFAQVPFLSISEDEERRDLPEIDFSIDDYIKERIENQIYLYYTPKVALFQKRISMAKSATFFLGFIGVILGALGTAGFSGYTSVWVAFVTSASGAIAAFMASSKYRNLITSHQATANHLKTILARFRSKNHTNDEAIRKLVYDCEAELARENKAWLLVQSDRNEKAHTKDTKHTNDKKSIDGKV